MQDEKIMQAFEVLSQENQLREQQPVKATLDQLRVLADEVLNSKIELENKN